MGERFIHTNGGEIYTDSAGSGPPLVFIHAGIATSDMWRDQIAYFSPAYKVIWYDTRGFGRSRTKAVTYSNREDLQAVLDHYEIEQAVLIGCSRGGQIATDFTLEYPGRVAALVTVASGVGGFELPPEKKDPRLEALIARFGPLEEAGDLEGINELEMQVFVDGTGQPAERVAADLRSWVKKMNRINLAHETNDGQATPIPLDPPAIGRLEEITAPLLIMVGDLDTPYAIAASEHLDDVLYQARLVRFEGAAHLPNLEQPDKFNTELSDFLHRIGW